MIYAHSENHISLHGAGPGPGPGPWARLHALEHFHGHKVVHSDVKPANILIDDLECARLANFDVSVRLLPKTG